MESQLKPAVRTLKPWQLTTALIVVTLVPFTLVVFLRLSLPDIQDPVLQAEVSVGPRAWIGEGVDAARTVPCAIVKNLTNEPWNNVNMSINDQFHFYHPQIVEGGGEVVVPLKFFHTKGNQYYPPASQKLNSITVYAQIPSGARAILRVEDDSLDKALRPKSLAKE